MSSVKKKGESAVAVGIGVRLGYGRVTEQKVDNLIFQNSEIKIMPQRFTTLPPLLI
jgi:hypothetical protein